MGIGSRYIGSRLVGQGLKDEVNRVMDLRDN